MFKKNNRILIANRGEIALRIIRACQKLNIETVLTVSDIDKDSFPAREADRCVCIGPSPSTNSYLNKNAVIMAALAVKADAVHPGYGFMAEQAHFFELCDEHGIQVIGPKSDHIKKMGDKITARQIVKGLGVPVIPGSEMVQDIDEAKQVLERVGYPALLKAAAGGGGKGMKIVKDEHELKHVFSEAAAEARAAFGDNRLYIEYYIPNARHVEVQVLGDKYGNVIHLFERDCSLQRRYQKMIEEAPSPAISSGLRENICQAALTIARNIDYEGAGTVEFILNLDSNEFFFLEMNTRIQVEHPITEMITGVDLVEEQIRIANDEPLRYEQGDIKTKGHSIECRINAESPELNFCPSPGKITKWHIDTVPGTIRVDSHCYTGYFVPPYYDSLIAKLIVLGKDRTEAIKLMKSALSNSSVEGINTTIPFYKSILGHRDFIDGNYNTKWVERMIEERTI